MYIEILCVIYLLLRNLNINTFSGFLKLLPPPSSKLVLADQFAFFDTSIMPVNRRVSFLLHFLINFSKVPLKGLSIEIMDVGFK